MALSSAEGKDLFVDWIKNFATLYKYTRYLDIGCGAGLYGILIRQITTPEFLRQFTTSAWWGEVPEIIVDAVEVFPEYIKRYGIDKIYNNITVADIRQIYQDIKNYDVIIMGDVLEHMTKEEAIEVVNALKTKCCFIWAALPMEFEGKRWSHGYLQLPEEWEENPYGKHLHDWTVNELKEAFNPLWIVPFIQTGTMLIEGEIVPDIWQIVAHAKIADATRRANEAKQSAG
jgi:SAM-dependent methyltransferase